MIGKNEARSEMPQSKRPRPMAVPLQLWLPYILATIMAAATFFIRMSLSEWIGSDRPALILCQIPIVISAYLWGMGPALLSTALIGIGVVYFVLPPAFSFHVARSVDLTSWTAMVACGCFISIMSGMLHRSRQQAEVNERLQATTIASIGEGLITTDSNGRISFLNMEAESLTGWDSREAVGAPLNEVFRIIDKESRTLLETEAIDALCKGISQKSVNRHLLLSRDGREIPIDYCLSPIRLSKGVVSGAVLVFSDRSAQNAAEQALRDSEQKYRDLFLNMSQGAFYHDAGGRIIDANPAALEIFGLQMEELLGKTSRDAYWNVIREDGSPLPTEAHPSMLALKTGEVVRDEVAGVFNARENKYVWLLINAIPQFHHGDPVARQVFVILHDITERKQAEERIRHQELILREAAETAHVGGWDFDPVTLEGSWTEETARIHDLPPGGALTATMGLKFFEGESRTRIEAAVKDAIELGKSYDLELKLISAKGAHKWVRSICHPIIRDNRVVRVRGSLQDITERKQAQEELKESRQQLANIIDFLPDATVVIDREGKVIAWNRSMELMTGIEAKDMLGKGDYEYAIPFYGERRPILADIALERQEAIEAEYAKLERKEGILIGEAYMPAIGNGKAYFSATASVLRDSKGDIVGAIESIRDLTEQKRSEAERERLEAQLLHAQKLESVGKLAGGVAHDFNNMLGVILGHCEMAMEQIDPGEVLYQDMREIQKAASRSADLTRQLLAFARKQTASPKVLDLNETISSMLKMLRRLIGEDINLVWSPGDNLWEVKVDPSQVDQILANLAINARDALSGTGAITLRTENVVAGASDFVDQLDVPSGDFVLLTVSDTGEGMDDETLQHIFEPFFTTKEVGRGTGLGLATVYGIVKQNGGFVCAKSKKGEGATFSIYLPRFKPQIAGTAVDHAPSMPKGGKENILLVEDDESILALTGKMLVSLGYSVLTAQSPKEAIRLLESSPQDIDLLITDVIMPEMNGRELWERISAVKMGLRCLYMSGYTADMIARQGLLEEGVQLISKPFTRTDLAAKVRQAMEESPFKGGPPSCD